MAPIMIYGMNPSPPCRVVSMTAEVLNVDYQWVPTNPYEGDTRTEEYLEMNPMHNIPVMREEHFVLNESRAIAKYLDRKYGDCQLEPECFETRAVMDQRLFFDIGTLYRRFEECMMPGFMNGEPPSEDKLEALNEALGWLDGFVSDGKFAAGNDSLTLADIALLATYSSIKACGFDVSSYENAEEWMERCIELIPNYERGNGEGVAMFGEMYKAKVGEE